VDLHIKIQLFIHFMSTIGTNWLRVLREIITLYRWNHKKD